MTGIGGAESSSKHTPRAYPAPSGLVPVAVAAARADRGGLARVPREALASEVVGDAVPADALGRGVLGEEVQRLALERDLGLAVGPHDGPELEAGRRRGGALGRQRQPDRGAAARAANRSALLLGRAVEREALRVDENLADARDRRERDRVGARCTAALRLVRARARASAGAQSECREYC